MIPVEVNTANNAKLRVLVFSPVFAGHCLQYLYHLLPAVSELVDEVVVSIPATALDTSWFTHHLEPLADQITIDATLDAREPGSTVSAFREASQLRRAIRSFAPDHILLPAADGLAKALAIHRLLGANPFPPGVESEGLILRGAFAYRGTGMRRRLHTWLALSLLARSPLTRVHFLDPTIRRLVEGHGGSLARRSALMPEPVEPPAEIDRQAARQQFGVAVNGRLMGCVGFMTRRKGIDHLLEAFSRAELGSADRLLLAGEAAPEIRDLLADRFSAMVDQGRIVVMDRILTDVELGTAVAAMDVVCAPHPAHIGSSGVVVRAAAAGRPLLASDFGWIGTTVERFALGRTCNVRDNVALAQAISDSLDDAPDFRLGPAARRFCEFHTTDNFRAAWTARLRERRGLEATPGAATWSWVAQALR